MSIPNPPLNSTHGDDRGFFERAWADFFTRITDALEDTPNVQTGDFTAGSSYRYMVDASAAPVTVKFPSVVGLNTKGYSITKTDSSANAVTIVPDGAETILGGSSLIITTQFDTPDLFPSIEDSAWYAE